MNGTKIIVVMAAFLVFGAIFVAAGIYFLSEKYMKALENSRDSEENRKYAKHGAKICGKVSMYLGAVTIVFGLIIKLIPEVMSYIVLVYVCALIAAFSVLIYSIKVKKFTAPETESETTAEKTDVLPEAAAEKTAEAEK